MEKETVELVKELSEKVSKNTLMIMQISNEILKIYDRLYALVELIPADKKE